MLSCPHNMLLLELFLLYFQPNLFFSFNSPLRNLFMIISGTNLKEMVRMKKKGLGVKGAIFTIKSKAK